MALPADVLRSSLILVASREPLITRRFCESLFARYPRTKLLFGRNTAEHQQRMLQEAIIAVVDHVEDAAWLTETLHGLGRTHGGYGVSPEMYAWVGDSLLATLAEIAADEWTPEVATAWANAYGAISSLMLEGARLDAQP